MIFEGIFEITEPRGVIKSEKEWAKYRTLGYTTGKSRE